MFDTYNAMILKFLFHEEGQPALAPSLAYRWIPLAFSMISQARKPLVELLVGSQVVDI